MNERWRMERIAKNEAMFRDINERLEAGLRQVRHQPDAQEFLCECGDSSCEQLLSLTFKEYEGVRRDSRHFLVAPGHVFPETERVITPGERFQVVEKLGASIDVADAADSRSPGDSGLRED